MVEEGKYLRSQTSNLILNSFPQDGILPSGIQVQNGPLLSLVDVQRQHAGVYQCTASNGIGQPVTSDIKLNVLCKIFFCGKIKIFQN